jgi:superoxide reductase
MTKMMEIYQCSVCGNVAMIVHPADGTLVCCGKPMDLLIGKTDDAGKEKHVPVVEKSAAGILVRVGSVPHPMEEKHFIEWIEVRSGQNSSLKRLKPGDKPEAEFCIQDTNAGVRIFCNVHGLWKNQK